MGPPRSIATSLIHELAVAMLGRCGNVHMSARAACLLLSGIFPDVIGRLSSGSTLLWKRKRPLSPGAWRKGRVCVVRFRRSVNRPYAK